MIVDRFRNLAERWNWRIAGPVIGAIVVVGLILAGAAGCSGDDQAVGPKDGSVQLDEKPRKLTWTTFQGVRVPVAEQGPRSGSEPAPAGYDQSPAGAALAAIQATIRMSVADDSQFPQVSAMLLAPGEGRDWFIANRLRVSTSEPVEAKDAPHVLAYQVTAYKDGLATVDIFTRYPDQSMTVNHTTVAWQNGGGWGLVVPVPEKMSGPAVEAVHSIPTNAVVLPQQS